jgi:hypothetical protein
MKIAAADFTAAGGCAGWREIAFFFIRLLRSVFCALTKHVRVRYCECSVVRTPDGRRREYSARARRIGVPLWSAIEAGMGGECNSTLL